MKQQLLAQNKKFVHVSLALLLAVAGLIAVPFAQRASAATFGQVFVRFDRMAVSTATTGTVCAMPSATDLSDTEANVLVTFPTGYTLGAYTTFTVNTTNLAWPAGASAWPGITAPAGAGDIVGQEVTFASSDLSSSSTLSCFNWTNSGAVQQPGTPNASQIGSITTTTSGDVEIDDSEYATATISNDQIVVTATVPVAFAFALSGNTDALGDLNIATVESSPTPRTATVNTNAKNGWLVWARDTNEGLASASASYTIASNCSGSTGSNSTIVAGTEGYNTGVTDTQAGGSGTVTVSAVFDSSGAGNGGGLCTEYQALATSDGSADDAVLTLTNNATIAGDTPAATDYTDTITVVGAGLF